MGLAMFVGVLPLEEMSRRAHSTELKVIWASCEPESVTWHSSPPPFFGQQMVGTA